MRFPGPTIESPAMNLLMIAALVAQPQDPDERLRALEERLAELERRHAEEVEALRAEIDRLRQEEAEKPPAEVTMADRLVIRSADGAFEIKPRGRVQADARFYGDPRAPAALIRSARLGFEGKLHGWVRYQIEGDFAPLGTFSVVDAWLELGFDPAVNLRIGRFKEPFSIENMTSESYMFALERSLLNNLGVGRGVGAELLGKPFGERFEYQVGIFSNAGGWDGVGRAILWPFRGREGPLQGLSFGGAAFLGGRLSGRPNALVTPPQTAFLTFPATTALRGRDRAEVELAWYNLGPISLWGECAWGDEEFQAAGLRRSVPVRAGHVTVAWMLTGEERGPSRVTPLHPVTLGEGGGAGAFELVGRYSMLRYGRRVFLFAPAAGQARRAHEFTAGLNWFLTSSLRLGVNYVHTRFGARVLLGSRPRRVENAILLRFQVEY